MTTPNGKYIKLSEPKVHYDEITCSYKMINKVHMQICNMVEKNIIDDVIAYAKENDVVDLILIDEQFVRNAIKHEAQLQSPTHQFKSVEHKPTNYDKITESVDALAEIMDNYRWCPYFLNSTCDSEIECLECIKEWLQKECDNG